MRKTLQPIVNRPEYAALVEGQLVEYLRETIFGPLLDMVREAGIETDSADQAIGKTPQIKNARQPDDDAVGGAIRSSKIWYSDGVFSGRFNAAISRLLRKIGAAWDPRTKTFRIPLADIPIALRSVLSQSEQKSAALHKELIATLTNMEAAVRIASTGLRYRKAVDKITGDLQKQFERTVPALESISVPAEITSEMRAAITASLTENLELYIKKFAAEEIPELRGLVEQNAFAGGRADRLAQIIEARYGVGKRKAQFLAEQETSLLVSQYREQRYKRLGVTQYVWSTAGDSRVRPAAGTHSANNHRRLDGRTFSWDSPPVVDVATGRRCHPGQDFGCRCTAMPILNLPGVSVLP